MLLKSPCIYFACLFEVHGIQAFAAPKLQTKAKKLGKGNYFSFLGWILRTRAGLKSESTDRSCQLRAGERHLSLAEHKHCYSVQGIFHLPPPPN